jgi:BirA family biotin operon repressor/biotin-[acetyl-CoA-carboxylase] ligase
MINFNEIYANLNTSRLGRDIVFFDKLNSTNSQAKNYLDNPEGMLIICEEQTAGRGRFNRKWSSPRGKGLWFSVILKPDISTQKVPLLIHLTAAAVVQGLHDMGIESWIKWPNDIVIQGKKVCGILCESVSLNKSSHAVILGIGVNVGQEETDFPKDIQDKATSILLATGKNYDRNIMIARIINKLESLYEQCLAAEDFEYVLQICRERSAVLGREILVFPGGIAEKGISFSQDNEQMRVHALEIDSEGCLLVKEEETGRTFRLVSGEVSLRAEGAYI